MSTYYKVTLSYVDFKNKAIEVTDEVNLWAERETNGLIEEIIPKGSVNDLTRLIFTNALYFKGEWNQKFNASKTKEYNFHLLNGSTVRVPFITSKEDQFIGVFDGFKVLRLLYKKGQDDRRFSMYFILPDAKDGLSTLVEKVAYESKLLHHIHQHLSPVEVGDFRIPRFNVSFELETCDMLKELGVVLPFSPGGLTNMVDPLEGEDHEDLYVSEIFHRSFIEINEEGTEAAAISAAIVTKGAKCIRIRTPRLDFVADHPFLFLIREDSTGTIIFVGHMLNPLVERS